MSTLQKTIFYDQHVAGNAKIVDFAGWQMPIQYGSGIIAEHLTTRKQAGLFDVSHMGRFSINGPGALAFMQYALTNDASNLTPGMSQYTILANTTGGAIDDAYLYMTGKDEFILVVNAANKEKDWEHLQQVIQNFSDVKMADISNPMAMVSLQGPKSTEILRNIVQSGCLPHAGRNALSHITVENTQIMVSQTGYTGEPVCYELFIPIEIAPKLWDLLCANGATPIGLGARDTLRLEAALPLYGHEYSDEIPIYTCLLAQFGVKFTEQKGDFIGREALWAQHTTAEAFKRKDYSAIDILPQRIRPFALLGKGIARDGCTVYNNDSPAGTVTSGTMAPYWTPLEQNGQEQLSDETGKRAIGLAMVDSRLGPGDPIGIEIRGKKIDALIVPSHLKRNTEPFAIPRLTSAS